MQNSMKCVVGGLISFGVMQFVILPACAPAMAAAQSGAALLVQVQPDAHLEAAAAPSWITSGDFQTLAVPLQTLIRLHRGTTAELTASASCSAGGGEAMVEIETDAGTTRLTREPVRLAHYSESGTYQESVRLRRPAPGNKSSASPCVELRVRSSDGTLDRSLVVLPQADRPTLSAK